MGDERLAGDPTARMLTFIRGGEAEEYALKVQLDTAGIFTDSQEESAEWLRRNTGELYDLFRELRDDQVVMADVPDLDQVDWLAIARELNKYRWW
ncbi:MAG: hypothetical protein R2761_00545 [Acidimicrobiales bacterium]